MANPGMGGTAWDTYMQGFKDVEHLDPVYCDWTAAPWGDGEADDWSENDEFIMRGDEEAAAENATQEFLSELEWDDGDDGHGWTFEADYLPEPSDDHVSINLFIPWNPSAPRMGGYVKTPIKATLRWQVFKRDNHVCLRCLSDEDLTVDHIVPEVRGGPTILRNLQTLCRPCNSRKGDRW